MSEPVTGFSHGVEDSPNVQRIKLDYSHLRALLTTHGPFDLDWSAFFAEARSVEARVRALRKT